MGGGTAFSSGNAHGAMRLSKIFTCVTLCAVDFVTWALNIHPSRPIGLV